ncbi:GNAT family N-acetyltransferase [Halobacillus sp. Marseille-P3879]|uniref:GNAT family N-acetyltransferase n=1 Tax=Halobacillus sp. Marseille-P3879 TaxID=2045014 RepID=UPI000C7B91C5|nr:GNAT family N-acetyltransferase [Halobacillus sp. Marseille-P3879]
MITVQLAASSHVKGIKRVCIDANRTTYKDLCKEGYIEKVIREFYNEERIHKEVLTSTKDWGGYFVALDSDRVVGAAGGGMISDNEAELYVLYLDPDRRNEGIGSKLLEAVTKQQKSFGAIEQWVSVLKGNQKGIPFYEARGFHLQYEKPSFGNSEEDNYCSLRYKRNIEGI